MVVYETIRIHDRKHRRVGCDGHQEIHFQLDVIEKPDWRNLPLWIILDGQTLNRRWHLSYPVIIRDRLPLTGQKAINRGVIQQSDKKSVIQLSDKKRSAKSNAGICDLRWILRDHVFDGKRVWWRFETSNQEIVVKQRQTLRRTSDTAKLVMDERGERLLFMR